MPAKPLCDAQTGGLLIVGRSAMQIFISMQHPESQDAKGFEALDWQEIPFPQNLAKAQADLDACRDGSTPTSSHYSGKTP
jgi:hypothetical protein